MSDHGMEDRPPFLADAMLGSLARKLRIFGFDTSYFRDGTDRELELVAAAERRVVLTSDRGLLQHARGLGLTAIGVAGRTDGARLRSLIAGARSAGLELKPGEPRCALCNGVLDRRTRRQVEGLLPVSVTGRHRLFFWCGHCGRYYWRGRHWDRMRNLTSLLPSRQ